MVVTDSSMVCSCSPVYLMMHRLGSNFAISPICMAALRKLYLWMLPQRFFALELHNDIVDVKGHPHLLHLHLSTLPAANYPTPECLGAILLCVNLIYNPPSGTDETSE